MTAFAVAATALALTATSSSAAPDNDNPQLRKPASAAALAAAAPDQCQNWSQPRANEGTYMNHNNVPWTYYASTYGANWFNVACSHLMFTVPAGQMAIAKLTASAELDCNGPVAGNSWCGSRFLINGLPLARPDNSGRGDTFAWDSGNGGAFDWQANTNDMAYLARCPASTNSTPCSYHVQLQSRLENGATSVWIDDLTITVEVTVGAVRVTNMKPTP